MKIKSILLVAFVMIMSANVNAATYSFSVDSFQVTGNLPVNIVDDFNDGSISPLWEVFDPTVVESGSTVTFGNPGTTVSSIQVGSLKNISSEMSYIGSSSPGPLQMQNGAGSFIGTSTWISAVPDTNQFFTMIITNIAADEDISISVSNFDSVFANAFGVPQGLAVSFGRFKDVMTGDFNVQGVSILPSDITGNILLSLAFDDATDLFQGAYSLDGGATYLSPFSAIAASSTVQEMGWNLGAESFAVVPSSTFLASGWEASDFLTLSLPTRSITFDSSNNLYIEDISDDNSGTIKILKLDAASGYSDPPSEFVLYATSYQGVTGLDFDGPGSLYVSERSLTGDAGVIREIDVTTQTLLGDVMTFANHRPTGVDADVTGNVFYTGRKESDGTFGNVYQIDSMGVRSILIDNIVATGIAVDASGNIFVSTPGRTDLALLSNSIYMFRSSDASLLNPVLIATFNVTGGELTFDDDGSLYMIADDKISIIKLIPADTDGDGLADYIDNCTLVSNSAQRDTDGDGYGNSCDPDFDNNLVVGAADLAFFKPKFFSSDPDADLNGDGVVSGGDLAILKTMFFKPPGPSCCAP